MRDIDIKCEDGNFKLRASALIIKDNKILLEKSQCEENCYGFPGGHIEFGEITTESILREVKEEINLDVTVVDLYCVAENIYINKNKINQEINYYYKLECNSIIDFNNFETVENDKGKEKHHYFYWFDINELDKIILRPIEVVKLIQKDISISNKVITIDSRI